MGFKASGITVLHGGFETLRNAVLYAVSETRGMPSNAVSKLCARPSYTRFRKPAECRPTRGFKTSRNAVQCGFETLRKSSYTAISETRGMPSVSKPRAMQPYTRFPNPDRGQHPSAGNGAKPGTKSWEPGIICTFIKEQVMDLLWRWYALIMQGIGHAMTGGSAGTQNSGAQANAGPAPGAAPRARRGQNRRRATVPASGRNRGNNGSPNTNALQVPNMFDELINRTTNSPEQDFRLAILNAMLRTPHRQVAPFMPLFKYVSERDPLFFAHLGAWYLKNGSVHDIKQLFIAFLVTSKFSEEHRNAGLAMLQQLPPYQVERVFSMVKGHKENNQYVEGVAATVPRSLRTAIEEYLRERERDTKAFDSAVLHARKPLKKLYASLRIKPNEYAQKILFDETPPEESRLYVLKQLAKESDPAVQAALIVENKIPYRVAVSGLKHVTPSLLAALVASMTPQEVINNLSSLKKRGAMDNEDLRKLIESKLETAKKDTRVSALKTREAVKAAGLDEEMTKKVESVGDEQIKSKARISRSTALHVDKSGSMTVAIECGKQIASIVAPICDADLFVYAFDTIAYPIKASGTNLSDWEKAFKGIVAGGSTSCGVAVETMRRNKQLAEQLIMVTDQGENSAPYLVNALQAYEKDMGILPTVLIVNIGTDTKYLERQLVSAGMTCDSVTFSGDYYSLPSLLPLIAGGTRLDLLMEIMSYPLPERKTKQLVGANK